MLGIGASIKLVSPQIPTGQVLIQGWYYLMSLLGKSLQIYHWKGADTKTSGINNPDFSQSCHEESKNRKVRCIL